MAGRATPEQLIGSKSERLFGVKRETINKEARTVEVAFASPTPVRRWWGDEVLEISAQAIRGTRLDDGAAVLVDHRSSDHVGVVEGWRIEGDRARATLRFGRSARAQEVFDDIVDGIRKHISVGYSIHNVVLQQRGDDGDTYLVTDWEPYEISVVGVPADPGVGVGRSAENATEGGAPTPPNNATTPQAGKDTGATTGARSMEENENETPAQAAAPAAPAAPASRSAEPAGDPAGAERQRASTIIELGEKYGDVTAAREYVASGKSVAAFQRHLLERFESKPVHSNGGEVGLSEREKRDYSFLRLLRAMAETPGTLEHQRRMSEAGLEFEAHQALVKAGSSAKRGGILIPAEVLGMRRRDLAMSRAWSPLNTGTSGTDTGDTGGKIVDDVLLAGSFIDILRNRMVGMRLGRSMTGLVGNVTIPRKISKGAGGWIGEDDNAGATGFQMDHITMSPKTAAAYNEVTRRQMMQSSLDVEQMIRSDLALALAETIDTAIFYGDPDKDANSPRGLKFFDGINTKDFTAVQPDYAELVGMETEIASDNADVNSMAYVVNAATRGALKTTEKFSGTNGAPVWEPGNTVNGYRTEVTNVIETGDVFFGNWSDMIIGMWGGFELALDPYTHSLKGRLRIVAFQDVDVVLRRLESFCYGVKPAPEPEPEP